MRIYSKLQLLSLAGALVLLAGCSGGAVVARNPITRTGGAIFSTSGIHADRSFDACPQTGQIVYVADKNNSVINIYSEKFAGQGPCGQIASGLLNAPEEIYVKASAHDLYVANSNGYDVLVFHRGQTTPYNTYTDPTGQVPQDVTVTKDGTVVASNSVKLSQQRGGSLSTWIGGPNGGTFVGNFPMPIRDLQGLSVTARPNGEIYFTDDINNNDRLWKTSCPQGACGTQTRIFVNFSGVPGGMQFDASGDLLVVCQSAHELCIFELPNPKRSTIPLPGLPQAMALNAAGDRLYVTDLINNDANEISYPSGVVIGTVPNNPGGYPAGIAIDP